MRGFATLMLCCALVSACDKGEEPRRTDLEAAAAAALGEGKDDKSKELEAAEAEARRIAFEKRKAEEAELKAKLDDIAARVVKQPAKPSKSLEKACDDLIVIYEEWVKKVYFDDDGFQLNFFDNKKANLGVVMSKCAKLQSIPATDCWIETIKGVAAEDFTEADAKLLQGNPEFLVDECIRKFAPELLQ